jgi:chemotaxis receptor (MCP) glutamine deamidase CheD
MMIDDLLQKGALLENLRAVVAGGALVGPVTAQDLHLDIGGRTTDVVKRILARKKGSRSSKEETGGFFHLLSQPEHGKLGRRASLRPGTTN